MRKRKFWFKVLYRDPVLRRGAASASFSSLHRAWQWAEKEVGVCRYRIIKFNAGRS